ncbi:MULTISPECIES: class I SAM-dependent methyltransferase [unclassified Mesorhizobium]|uniref:class I SAM-dependent methyltransferase n=1 Tax=unclassified Mesorhizobium TaxID=325217 RepID=UPI000FD8BFAB|nr:MULTISPECIES: class I SAM-dependent methyltransferase [unclassified Mesorhizobium]TGQ48085.1 class I SAM-dependent methyltransferase [Mesorhizobium sp. M00.F.Ca.ET.216.01.1.1]TIS54624.1 MAG: methyltransferase domain-containing protein [Mesorhizobium sp.]TIS90170.1 MAG: methyltransferase domain-containing protein [Mesorhizobium sp.]TJW17636.1 MAG: methyltransferase domain-containing protein [Mesorhizobium sp.]
MNTSIVERRPNGQSEICDGERYTLGYSEGEFKRLQLQGDFVRDLTEDVLRRAGLKQGMRVLDLGCGVGDVSLLAGQLVGPGGSVLGIDRSQDAVKTAQRRAVETGQCYWVRFASADLASFVPEREFDAIIGRLVLMYLPDPAATLRRLAGFLRPGGIVAFQEMSMPFARSFPETPLFMQVLRWIIEAFVLTGFETDMGGKLFSTYLAAGLPAPQMISGARAEGGVESLGYEYIAQTVRSLIPAMERTGIATAADIGIDDLADRLRDEAVAHSACIMFPPMTGAWTRLP